MNEAVHWLEEPFDEKAPMRRLFEMFYGTGGPMIKLKYDNLAEDTTWQCGDAVRWPEPFPWDELAEWRYR